MFKRYTPIEVDNSNFKRVSLNQQVNQKHIQLPMSDIFIDFLAQQSVDAIDHRVMTGLPTSERSKKLLYDWDFETIKAQMGYQLSKQGSSFAYIIPDNMTPGQQYSVYHGQVFLTEGTSLFNPSEVVINNPMYDQRSTFGMFWNVEKFNKGAVRIWKKYNRQTKAFEGVWYETGYWKKGEFTSTSDEPQKLAGWTRIPGSIIRNTSIATTDWERVYHLLLEMDVVMNDVGIEWEYIKTTVMENTNYGNSQKSTQEHNIQNGGRVRKAKNINSKYKNPTEVFMSGSTTLADIVTLYNFLEDKAMKFALAPRETTTSGAQKNNQETSMFNQHASQYFNTKKEQRERDWTRFFRDIVGQINSEFKNITVELTLSEFEQQKIDGAQAEIDVKQAQAYNYKETVDNQMKIAKINAEKPAPKPFGQ